MTTDNAINMTCETQTFLVEDRVERQIAKRKGKLSLYLILSVIVICVAAILVTLVILSSEVSGKNPKRNLNITEGEIDDGMVDGEIPEVNMSSIESALTHNKINSNASISPPPEITEHENEIITTTTNASVTPLSTLDYSDSEYDDFFEKTENSSSTTPRSLSELIYHPNYDKFNKQCGTTQSSFRIQEHKKNSTHLFEHPWMIALMIYNKTSGEELVACGGSLLNEEIILTAAHCIRNEQELEMCVRVGEFNIETEQDCETIHDAKQCADPVQIFYPSDYEIIIHPQYSPNDGFNDLAIIKLKTPVTFSKSVLPICLPFNDDNIPNKVEIIGYGKTIESKKQPEKPQKGYVHTLDFKHVNCSGAYENLKNPRILTENQFCANQAFNKTSSKGIVTKASTDTCKGDSGSPALWLADGKQTLFGVVSAGEKLPCSRFKVPGIYMKVYPYLKWILDNA